MRAEVVRDAPVTPPIKEVQIFLTKGEADLLAGALYSCQCKNGLQQNVVNDLYKELHHHLGL